ncbi:MAG: zinc-ribbon domain containing protein [Clostridia bacterium]|nr:zinc-ribbon domain containing protein [Clostridia bacterium]
MYQDEMLKCRVCGNAFIFGADEQSFYAEQGYQKKPRRCPECRMTVRALSGTARPQREEYDAVCAACGKATKVPFKPKNEKPVYCRDCYSTRPRN